uniref:Uncharacterized protein n=1 Tax=Geospiza parvula TaxID=87175 RepID=A0A8U8BPR0_GEOPR
QLGEPQDIFTLKGNLLSFWLLLVPKSCCEVFLNPSCLQAEQPQLSWVFFSQERCSMDTTGHNHYCDANYRPRGLSLEV